MRCPRPPAHRPNSRHRTTPATPATNLRLPLPLSQQWKERCQSNDCCSLSPPVHPNPRLPPPLPRPPLTPPPLQLLPPLRQLPLPDACCGRLVITRDADSI